LSFEMKRPGVVAVAQATASSPRSVDLSAVEFEPLPGTGEEAAAIKAIIPSARVLVGAEATESELKQVRGPDVLHVATHGFFLPDQRRPAAERSGKRDAQQAENPLLRSGLVLAGANRFKSGVDDGILTALEAAALDLVGTQLVVLSAVRRGSGILPTARVSMACGARS
jgi:CHAT domain-containing protein